MTHDIRLNDPGDGFTIHGAETITLTRDAVSAEILRLAGLVSDLNRAIRGGVYTVTDTHTHWDLSSAVQKKAGDDPEVYEPLKQAFDQATTDMLTALASEHEAKIAEPTGRALSVKTWSQHNLIVTTDGETDAVPDGDAMDGRITIGPVDPVNQALEIILRLGPVEPSDDPDRCPGTWYTSRRQHGQNCFTEFTWRPDGEWTDAELDAIHAGVKAEYNKRPFLDLTGS